MTTSSLVSRQRYNNSEAAVGIWSRPESAELEDDMFPGLEFYCRHLSQCSEEIIFSHCDAALDRDQLIAAKIFMKPQLRVDSDSTFVDRALNVLTKYNDARTELLICRTSRMQKPTVMTFLRISQDLSLGCCSLNIYLHRALVSNQ